MSANFLIRLRDYYQKVGEVLRGDAEAAAIFPNSTDVGQSREKIYADFLSQHAPSKCNVFLGGFLFDEDGVESKQLDVIVATDTAPRFNFHNKDGSGKSFSPVEGTLGAVSIKSCLDKAQLFDALAGIASIPATKSLEGRVSFTVQISNYDDWPYKIVYATKGVQGDTIMNHLNEFYSQQPEIPFTRRPNVIHVAGQYVIFRVLSSTRLMSASGDPVLQPEIGTFRLMTRNPDLQGIIWALDALQQNAATSTDILFNYSTLLNKVNSLTQPAA